MILSIDKSLENTVEAGQGNTTHNSNYQREGVKKRKSMNLVEYSFYLIERTFQTVCFLIAVFRHMAYVFACNKIPEDYRFLKIFY
jgi:hypothetical protein